jgi:hypothetical protein
MYSSTGEPLPTSSVPSVQKGDRDAPRFLVGARRVAQPNTLAPPSLQVAEQAQDDAGNGAQEGGVGRGRGRGRSRRVSDTAATR